MSRTLVAPQEIESLERTSAGTWRRVWPYGVAVLAAVIEIVGRGELADHTELKVAVNFLYPLCMAAGLTLGPGPSLTIAALGLLSLLYKNTAPSIGAGSLATGIATFSITILAFNWAIVRRNRAQRLALLEATRRTQAEGEAQAATLEREAVAKLLGVHEAKSRALATALPVGVWISHDARAKRVTGNEEALRMLRLPGGVESSVGRGGEGDGFELRRDGAAVATGDLPMVRASRGEDVRGDDIEVVFKDGARSVLRVSATPLLDGAGAAAGAVGVVVDITERRRAEEKVKESEGRFRVMGDHAPVLLWMANDAKKFVWFNRPWLEFVGRTMEQEVGYGWADSVHPDDRRRCVEVFESHADKHEPFRVKYRLRRRDGEFRWMLVHGVPLGAGAGFSGYIGALTDITDIELSRRGIESYVRELERANRELEDFAHIAAHDLKEPLRGMRLVASFLQEDFSEALGTEGAMRLRTLQDLCERSQRLLDSLMEVAQVARADPSLEECRVGDIAAEAIHMLAARLRDGKAEVVVDPASDDVMVTCDRRRTVQALMNLISNGLKYNESEKPRVEVGTQVRDGVTAIVVRDNGIGIPAERHKDIFQLFRRLHGREAYGGGAGAGLAIVKRIAERHGGEVWVESEVGRGAAFYMTLGQGAGVETSYEPGPQ